jgi:hypothetical protein
LFTAKKVLEFNYVRDEIAAETTTTDSELDTKHNVLFIQNGVKRTEL